MFKGKQKVKNMNKGFVINALANNDTYYDIFNRLKKIALSMFEWVNLPSSMSSKYLEECLFYDGFATLLKDERYGYINTRCCSCGNINIYGIPTDFNCYSYEYHARRKLYTGLVDDNTVKNSCILVINNKDLQATASTLSLFAYRLYEAEMTAMTNIKAQKTPVMILASEKQRQTMETLYKQYDGNYPVIFGDKDSLDLSNIKSINTEAKFIANDIMEYKKLIWNEALTFLGINNIEVEKKERLVKDESNANNELINLNLQSYLIPRQEACKQFNELFGLTGTDKEISVRLRSDLLNVIKNNESIVSDYNNNGVDDSKEDLTNE